MPKTKLFDQDDPANQGENRDTLIPLPTRGPLSALELSKLGIDLTVCWCGCGEPAGTHCSGCGRTLT